MQPTEVKTEIGEHVDDAYIAVAGVRLEPGTHVPSGLGINPETTVDHRLLAVIAFLGLRRMGGLDGGWVSAPELAFAIDGSTSPTALCKFLQRRILPYYAYGRRGRIAGEHDLSSDTVPQTHLIQYAPREPQGATGLSRGPYRLGGRLGVFSQSAAWRLVLGSTLGEAAITDHAVVPEERFAGGWSDHEELLAQSNRLIVTGDLIASRVLVAAQLRSLLLSGSGPRDPKKALRVLAPLLAQLANLDMELGQTRLSIDAAERAAMLFARLGDAGGRAHALQVAAHAYGQLEDVSTSHIRAKSAKDLCDSSRAIRAGAQRAMFIGVLGQRESKIGMHRSAERKLAYAMRTCNEAGLTNWGSIWSLRRAENFIAAGDLAAAEQHLLVSHDLANSDLRTTVPHWAAITRITSLFHVTAGDRMSAIPWARHAWKIGVERKMANQIRLMRPILAAAGIEDHEADDESDE